MMQTNTNNGPCDASHPVGSSNDIENCQTEHREALVLTRQEYEEIAASYTDAVSLPDIISMERGRIEYGLMVAANRGEQPSSVLDVGCAGARDLETWVQNGITYYGVDYSSNLIDIASNRADELGVSSASFKRANLIEMDISPESVSIVWCSSVIQHVPKDRVSDVLSNFYNALEEGGILYLNVRPPKEGVPLEGMVSSQEYTRTDGQKHVERFVSHYELTEMESLLKHVGFTIEKGEVYSEVYDQYDDGGQKAAYLPEKFVIFARKNTSGE